MTPDRRAALAEQIGESALAAEHIFPFLRYGPEGEVLDYLRLRLRAHTALDLAYHELKRVLEQRIEAMDTAAEAADAERS